MSNTTVSPETYRDWLQTTYDNLGEDNNKAITSMLMAFIQSYEMLSHWKLLNVVEYLEDNQLDCARIWYDFCIKYNLGKGAIKAILSLQAKQLKESLDQFAETNGCETFYEWLDHMDRLALSLLEESQDDRPFFSLVIACYNDGRYVEGKYLDRLLDSLLYQDIDKDDLEVILSDDCSPVPFDDIVDKYKDKLNIVRTQTEYNFAPGNTRQKGTDIATGRWLCFADHDDVYCDHALSKVREFIRNKNEKLYVFSPFHSVDYEGNLITTYQKTMGWCHGKFYNMDNFWKRYDIHFIHDLPSHEDIAICTQVSCTLDRLGENLEDKYLDFVTYAWTNNPESVSHTKYELDDAGGPRTFLEVYFGDYMKSTGYIYLDLYQQKKIIREYAVVRCLEVLCFAYFYTQGFQFARKDFKKENLIVSGDYLNQVKKIFDIKTNAAVYKYVATDDGAMYRRIRPLADPAVRYIPQQGFKQWLDLVDREYKKSLHNT